MMGSTVHYVYSKLYKKNDTPKLCFHQLGAFLVLVRTTHQILHNEGTRVHLKGAGVSAENI